MTDQHAGDYNPQGCVPPNPIWQQSDPLQPNPMISIPSVWTNPDMTVLDLAKALRECFAQTHGRIPVEPLDREIEKTENPLMQINIPPKSGHEQALDLLEEIRDANQLGTNLNEKVIEFLKAQGR